MTRRGNVRASVEERDFEAARRALARNWPDLASDSLKYAEVLKFLADFHRQFGSKNFELRYNLRPPKDRVEVWTRELMHGTLTEAEFGAHLKADAERPIDLEMLKAVHDGYERRLGRYSRILQRASSWSVNPLASRQGQERIIDEQVAGLNRKLPVWREHLETVFEFLEEQRVASGQGLVVLGEFEGTSAHWLAQLVFRHISQGWMSCTRIADRSRKDARYLYQVRALEMFCEHWLAKFPKPQSIQERMREEYVAARMALRTTVPAKATAADVSATMSPGRDLDNESQEAILMGQVMTIVGNAGHIFRPISNWDWGIDGEIEFKDDAGKANGKRLYLQLKSGDSHLTHRQRDGAEVFRIKNERHAEYWQQHAYPVMLVIRTSDGVIRWMDVSAYLREATKLQKAPIREIIFQGEPFTPMSVHSRREG